MTPEKALQEAETALHSHDIMAKQLRRYLVALGLTTIVCSLFITAFAGTALLPSLGVKIVSFISAVSLGVLASFNIAGKGNNARNAYQHVLNAKRLFICGKLTEEELLKALTEAEDMLGAVDFNYAMPRASKPGEQ